MPVRTVAEYLPRCGYTPKRPGRPARGQDPAEGRRGWPAPSPALAARAARAGAASHWGAATGVARHEPRGRGYAGIGEPPALAVTPDRLRVHASATRTKPGTVRFLPCTATFAAAVFRTFRKRWLPEVPRKRFLLGDPHPAPEAAAGDAWREPQRDRSERFAWPGRAPAWNPEAYVNQDLNSQGQAERLPERRADLPSPLQRLRTQLQTLPDQVKH